MQPTQADAIAAYSALIDMLQGQSDNLSRQVSALHRMADALDSIKRSARSEDQAENKLTYAVSEFLRAYAQGQESTIAGLKSAISHNQRLVDAARSNIIIPTLHPTARKM